MMRLSNNLISDTTVSNSATSKLISPMFTTITTTALMSHTALRTYTNSILKPHAANFIRSNSSTLTRNSALTITFQATHITLTMTTTKASTRSPRPVGDPNHGNRSSLRPHKASPHSAP